MRLSLEEQLARSKARQAEADEEKLQEAVSGLGLGVWGMGVRILGSGFRAEANEEKLQEADSS